MRTVGAGLALTLVAAVLPASTAQAQPPPKTPLTITFLDGPTAENGSSVHVLFDANGNTAVTGFRYSITGDQKLALLATPDVPGGTATVTLLADHLGILGVHLGDQDTRGAGSGDVYYSEITVVGDPSLSGTLSLIDIGYRAGVVISLGPGGQTTTTDANGYFRFDHLTPGQYSLHSSYEQGCDLELDESSISVPDTYNVTLWMENKKDAAGYLCFTNNYSGYQPGDTVLDLTGDNAVQEVTIPFAFLFYSQSYSSLWVDTNGYITFEDPGSSQPAAPADFPSTASPNLVVAPYWDDLIVDSEASIRTKTVVSPDYDGSLVIDWHNVARAADPNKRFSFSVTLYGGAGGYVDIDYQGLDSALGSSSTVAVGIDGPTDNLGVRYDQATEPLVDTRSLFFHGPAY
jgi:hypothetical protein